ncbi:uncharacterized protein LOC103573858 [Microplitis demolitor]|uniref:uncharacterized protein LOC103573858 n=1 Tax=Microplitis demolitor TaxID=69319 RepID=UPI0004CCC1F3|nr:uncharacterized protein LOC103573858 [Microplitis demolitor]
MKPIEMSVTSVEETIELLHNQDIVNESYFTEYATQKEIINRNRLPSRRLLSQAALLESNVMNNSVFQPSKDFPVINFIHTVRPNWPPSRKREEAQVLENLQKLVERSELFKAYQSTGSEGLTTAKLTQLNNNQHESLDNRPELLRKILLNRPMNIFYDLSDFETNWRDSEFITECLCWHNVYRQRHNARPLTMAPKLCEYAQTWANHLAHTNTFYYRNDREVGQNLYCRPGGPVSGDVGGQDVSSYWYSGVKHYNFFKESDILHTNVNTGHFTQLIWSSSQYFGVGKARSRSGKIIVVATYKPVGNVSGQFQKNVSPPFLECASSTIPPSQISDHDLMESTMSISSNNSSIRILYNN